MDKKTVTQVLDKLKKEFKINKCVFVGDRGLVSATNIEELEDHGFEYILALKKRRNNKVKSILSKSEGQEWVSINKELKYREVEMDETLYIICYNPEIGKEQKAGREANLKKLENELHRLAVKVNSMKRPAIKTIVRQVEDILSHKHGRRLLNYKVDEKTRELSYWRKKEAIELEEKIDGVWFLCTKEKSLKAREIIYAYKDLANVERAFRTMKSSLDLRPYFHRTRERVNAHTFICVLAYFLEKVIENALKKQGIKISGQKALQSLRQIGVAVIKVEDEYYGYVTEVTYRQKQVLDSLNLKLPSRIITHKN